MSTLRCSAALVHDLETVATIDIHNSHVAANQSMCQQALGDPDTVAKQSASSAPVVALLFTVDHVSHCSVDHDRTSRNAEDHDIAPHVSLAPGLETHRTVCRRLAQKKRHHEDQQLNGLSRYPDNALIEISVSPDKPPFEQRLARQRAGVIDDVLQAKRLLRPRPGDSG